ncbi:MBL fold metallo-hydrolase [Zavarzinia aquatilis]|uniref:MBL fold metallo-hydrolase n=1 Tax=Zavarzinia aquatilis TaxID=2211142 RepID=A0A317EFH0_9PROT|nr:MBL fold metallo-hydrolase [Zavarzinia aquatilis]PWR25342.1 MBL fold metallo-hydrolase [Zavarzinia aquatilis]
MTVELIVHRGTREIGGSCIEIRHSGGDRLILDAGRPLDAPDGASGLLPASLDRRGLATVLISHPHQDHWGLSEELPAAWPVWTGAASARLIGLTADTMRRPLSRTLSTWDSRGGPLALGPFTVTPILTDHSAFDAHMLLIDCDGRRILYTGDFRRHGRKSVLVDRMMATPPSAIDVMLTEGTNLGTDKPTVSEADLEKDFATLIDRTPGRLFVSWSAQNIDRTVTLFRAARQCGRTLVIDLYTADVLDHVAPGTRLPHPGLPDIKVVMTHGLAAAYRRRGREDYVRRMVKQGISAARLQSRRDVVMLRQGLLHDYQHKGVVPCADDALCFSMWRGYFDDPRFAGPLDWCRSHGVPIHQIHTSGHASPADLRAFAGAMKPGVVVPVHGVKWDEAAEGFPPLRRLDDGDIMRLP